MENCIRKYILKQGKTIIVPAFPMALYTGPYILQQLQNLTSDDIIHGYQTCPLIESFFFPRTGDRTDVTDVMFHLLNPG